MKDSVEIRGRLKSLLRSQRLAVLSTQRGGQPYASLVAFAATDDLRHLLFATARGTRKHANLLESGRAAMLVDNRSNEESDFEDAIAATATGIARELTGSEKEAFLEQYLKKHPYLSEFVSAPSCAFFGMRVETYYVVTRFQEVVELHISE